MAADIRLRWVLDVVDKGAPAKVLAQDRAIRSSLTKTDAQYQRTAATAASASSRQATSVGRVTTSMDRLGRAQLGTTRETTRLASAQREALTVNSRVATTADRTAAAYSRQGRAARAAALEESRAAKARSKALSLAGVGGAAVAGASVIGAGAKVAGAAFGGGALVAGGATLAGIRQGGELGKEAAGLKGLVGVTSQQAVALAVVGKSLGLNVKSLGMIFGTLGKQAVGYEKGVKSSVAAFKALDLSPQRVASLKNNLPALFDLVFERTQKLPAAQRATYLKQLAGRGGVLAGQIESLGPLAGQIGGVQKKLGGVSLKDLEEMHHAEVELKEETVTLELSFAQTFGPSLVKLFHAITPAIKPIGEALKTSITTPIQWVKDHGIPAVKDLLRGIKGDDTPKPGRGTQGRPPILAPEVARGAPPNLPVPGQPAVSTAQDMAGARPPSTLQRVGTVLRDIAGAAVTAGKTITSVAKDIGQVASEAGHELINAFKPWEPFARIVLVPLAKDVGKALLEIGQVALKVGIFLTKINVAALVISFHILTGVIKVTGTVLSGLAIAGQSVARFLVKLNAGINTVAKAIGGFVGSVASGLAGVVGRVAGFVGKVVGTVRGLPGRLGSIGLSAGKSLVGKLLSWVDDAGRAGGRIAGSAARGIGSLAGKVAGLGKSLFNSLWGLGRELVKAIVSGIKSLPGAIWDAIKGLAGKGAGLLGKVAGKLNPFRRGGRVRRYAGGGMVGAMLSPGEQVVYGDAAWTVPGARVAADSVHAELPIGAAVLTGDGQRMVRSGASVGEAISYQRPHFAKGGFVSTAYGPPWGGIQGGGTTATGINLKGSPHVYLVAVDPSVIPLHSKLKISPNPFGNYAGNFAAEDTGGAIKGNRIDFYDWRGRSSQNAWGRREVAVSRTGRGGPLPGGVGASKALKQDIRLGPSRTRAGLVPDALTQGVQAGEEGLTPQEIERARRGGRGARSNPIIASIVEGIGAVSKTVSVKGAAKAKRQAAGGPAKLALGGTEKAGIFAGVRVGVANMARETIRANPGLSVTSTTGGTHAAGSFHPQGRAVDVAGANMNRAAAWLKGHYGRVLTEGIHNPNLSIKYGKDVPPSFWGPQVWAGHASHIHMALRRGGIAGRSSVGRIVSGATPRTVLDKVWQILSGLGALPRGARKPSIVVVPGAGNHDSVNPEQRSVIRIDDLARFLLTNPHPENKREQIAINAAHANVVHELAHTMQRGIRTRWEAEGGAQAWADEWAPRVFGGGYRNPGDFNYSRFVAQVRKKKGMKWINRGQFGYRSGGVIGSTPRLGGPVGAGVKEVIATAGKPTAAGPIATLESLLSETTTTALERIRQQFTSLARKGGPKKVVAAFQSVIDLTESLIGGRIGNFNEEIARLGTQSERHQGRVDRSLRKRGVDPASAEGLKDQIAQDADTAAIRKQQVERAKKAYAASKRTGNVTLIAAQAEKLASAEDELDEAVTKAAEDQRALIEAQELAFRTAAQEVSDTAAFNLSSAQNSLAGYEIEQRRNRTAETPGGLRGKAGAIESMLVPALQNNLAALNNQLGILQQHGASASEIQSILTSIQTTGNEIGSALADVAELIRHAAEQAAEELVEKAGHLVGGANLGLQHEELEERINGTYDTGGQRRADYIHNTIIPAIQGEIAALFNEYKVAQEQGNTKLAEQIAEQIAGRQNGVLEETLKANEEIADNTKPQHKVGGQVSFAYGQENITDSLIAVGSGA